MLFLKYKNKIDNNREILQVKYTINIFKKRFLFNLAYDHL